jgi:hypothetical protein
VQYDVTSAIEPAYGDLNGVAYFHEYALRGSDHISHAFSRSNVALPGGPAPEVENLFPLSGDLVGQKLCAVTIGR